MIDPQSAVSSSTYCRFFSHFGLSNVSNVTGSKIYRSVPGMMPLVAYCGLLSFPLRESNQSRSGPASHDFNDKQQTAQQNNSDNVDLQYILVVLHTYCIDSLSATLHYTYFTVFPSTLFQEIVAVQRKRRPVS